LIEISQGNLQRAERFATIAARLAQQLDGDDFHPAAAEVAHAWVKAQESDLPAARQHADRASASLSGCHDRIAAAALAVVKARLHAGHHHARSGNTRSGSEPLELREPLPSWLAFRLTAARGHLLLPSVAKVPSIHPRATGVIGGSAKPATAPATDDVPAAVRAGESHNQERAALEAAIIEPLTDREMQVLEKLSAHYSTEEIADVHLGQHRADARAKHRP
jgi:hypothetical protein